MLLGLEAPRDLDLGGGCGSTCSWPEGDGGAGDGTVGEAAGTRWDSSPEPLGGRRHDGRTSADEAW